MQQLDVTYNNVKLLTDMLYNHQPDTATESDKEIMKVFVFIVTYCSSFVSTVNLQQHESVN